MAFQYYHKRSKQPPATMQLAELLGMLSYALDMTEGQPQGHCIRSCWIGTKLGMAMGMDERDLYDLYFTLLLKDLGCSSNAARICALYLTDDISFKRDFKYIDGSLNAALRFVFAKTGLQAGLAERFRATVHILQNGGEISKSLMETRCQRGAEIAAKLRFGPAVQDGIRALDEHWNGGGKPLGLKETAIPMAANIALLAQVVDIFHTAEGAPAALREIESRSGTWFNPDLVAAFAALSADGAFWRTLKRPDIDQIVFALPPGQKPTKVTEGYLDDIAAAFASVIDAKSPFTADHSARVTLYTDTIAEQLGLDQAHRRWLRRAALLHDLGKLAVSNQVLDKPSKLDDDEWQAIRAHSRHSEEILTRVSAFHDIAPIAGAHHERLDGHGYPYGLKGDQIGLEVRILTVADVFDALSAERPYRAAIPIDEVFKIMERDIGTAFDATCIDALKRGMKAMNARAA